MSQCDIWPPHWHALKTVSSEVHKALWVSNYSALDCISAIYSAYIRARKRHGSFLNWYISTYSTDQVLYLFLRKTKGAFPVCHVGKFSSAVVLSRIILIVYVLCVTSTAFRERLSTFWSNDSRDIQHLSEWRLPFNKSVGKFIVHNGYNYSWKLKLYQCNSKRMCMPTFGYSW